MEVHYGEKIRTEKGFLFENGEYIEISYEELCRREENDPSYKDKFFIPLHGMIMEVDETAYPLSSFAQRKNVLWVMPNCFAAALADI